MIRFQNEDFILETTDPVGEDPGVTTLVHPQYAGGNPIIIDVHFGALEASVAHEEWVDKFLMHPPECIMDQATEQVIVREFDERLRLYQTAFKNLRLPDL